MSQTYVYQMVGTWVEQNVDFKFEAAYIANDDGIDTFTGTYDNAGLETANITAKAVGGVWTIVLTYVDAGHKGTTKTLIGRGSRDRATGLLKIEGDYKTFFGSGDVKQDGRFRILGFVKK